MSALTNLLIKKLNDVSTGWQKPWLTKHELLANANIDGRTYKGINSFLLMLLRSYKHYTFPLWITFNRCQTLAKEMNLNITIKKGEKSSPVSFLSFLYIDEDGKKINAKDAKKGTIIKRVPYSRTYNVFNIDQTNIKDTAPLFYSKICKKYDETTTTTDRSILDGINKFINNNEWICPIKLSYQDSSYYNISDNVIVMPIISQFKNINEFYSSLFHEMAHSTARLLNRDIDSTFGSEKYAREELVAELTSVMLCSSMGIEKYTSKNNCCYIKAWIKKMHQEPSFLAKVFPDVKNAYNYIMKRFTFDERL